MSRDEPYPRFPQLTLMPSSEHAAGLEAVREIFRREQDAHVTEDRSGIIRIVIGALPTDLLSTKIARLTFSANARWNPILAITAIEGSTEVVAARRKLNLLPSPPARLRVIDIILGPTGNNYPHLPPSLENVTLDQALDAVATTFKQLVIFGACKEPGGQGTISIEYTPLTECESRSQGMPCFVPEAKMGYPTPLELSPAPSLPPNTSNNGALRPPIGAPGAMLRG